MKFNLEKQDQLSLKKEKYQQGDTATDKAGDMEDDNI